MPPKMMQHRPVLLDEVLGMLRPAEGKKLLDGTFGRGGHSKALLDAGAQLVALDRDPEAVNAAAPLVKNYPGRFEILKMNFAELEQAARTRGPFDGILLDLGVSSPQLDQAGRGFSFQKDGPLDMRMDNESGKTTAADLVNQLDEDALAKLLWENGEERASRRLAHAIVRRRQQKLITRTAELMEVVESCLGGRRNRSIHPATKTFQALRIAVNDELGALDRALSAMPGALLPGGRMAIISFHALEDRRVKSFITRHSTEEIRGKASPFGSPNPDYCLRSLGRFMPAEQEIENNPRARSARLRGAEKLS